MSFNTLTWGVKASFRNYVEGAGGSIIASDGATRTEDGAFTFKAAPDGDLVIAPDGSATGSARFLGKIMFEAHGGMLSSTLTDLCLEVTDEGLVLTVLDAPMNQDRCAIATLSPTESSSTGAVVLKTEITVDGMYQIADNYPPGTELDELRLD